MPDWIYAALFLAILALGILLVMTNDINDKVLTENQKDYVIDLIRNLNKKYEDIIQEINHEVPSKDKIVHELDQLSFLSKNLSDCVYGLSTDF